MAKVAVEIPNTEENISRPVALSVTRQVVSQLGISSELSVRFVGTGGSLSLSGSTLDDKASLNRLPGDANITISVEEEYDPANALSTMVYQQDNPYVFSDPLLNIALRPVYQRVKNTITFKIVSTDKSTVDNWESTLKRRQSQGIVETYHTANYHYPIPPQLMLILIESHRLRELNHGYGEDFGQWWRKYASKRHTVVVDQAGNNGLLCVKEQQIGILGYFDFLEQPPKPEKINDSGAWGISFSYTYFIDYPKSMVLDYSLMVHNQLLDEMYYNSEKPRELEDHNRYYTVADRILHDYTWESRNARAWMGYPGVPIPHFDDWLPANKLKHTRDIFRIQLQTDLTNPHAVISLYNMGSYALIPEALDYLRLDPRAIADPYENVFNISLYRGEEILARDNFIVSPDIDIHVARPLNPRENYHLLVSLVDDITVLSARAISILCQSGIFTILYLLAIYPFLARLVDINNPLGGIYCFMYRLPDGTWGLRIPRPDGNGYWYLVLQSDGTIAFANLMALVDAMRILIGAQAPGSSSNSSLNPARGWRLVNLLTILSHRSQ